MAFEYPIVRIILKNTELFTGIDEFGKLREMNSNLAYSFPITAKLGGKNR
jgi:hypothetical protein